MLITYVEGQPRRTELVSFLLASIRFNGTRYIDSFAVRIVQLTMSRRIPKVTVKANIFILT